MESNATKQEIRNDLVAFLLLVFLVLGVVLLVAGIFTANALLAVLGLSFIIGFVVFSALFVKMIGPVKRITLFRRESTPPGE
jgi:hypothetical protein